VQMGEVANVVNEQRTAGAARFRPALDARGEHKVVDDQLAAAIEQIEQGRLAVRALEDVLLLDPDHREPASLCGKRVARSGEFLLLGQQFLAGCKPLVWGHYLRKIPLAFRHDDFSFDSDRVLVAITCPLLA
jgi:hypothetical protein